MIITTIETGSEVHINIYRRKGRGCDVWSKLGKTQKKKKRKQGIKPIKIKGRSIELKKHT